MIISRLEEYDYAAATTIAVVMLLISFAILFLINCCRPGPAVVPGELQDEFNHQ